MIQRLVQYVSSIPSDDLKRLTLEDMSLALAYARSAEDATAEAIEPLVKEWAQVVEPPSSQTAGRRQQPILRRLLNHVVADSIEELTRSDLDVLHSLAELTEIVQNRLKLDRIAAILSNQEAALEARRNELEPVPDLAELSADIMYLTSDDLRAAAPKKVNSFAGIDLSGQGPLTSIKGDVKVLDGVPENCMLGVDGGSCWVTGYVLGRIAVTHDCTVQENVSGAIIAAQGDIRARNVVSNALLIAKTGTVALYNAEGPSLVFGGKTIEIEDSATGGAYIGPVIEVGGEITGGEYTFCKRMDAVQITPAENRKTTVALHLRVTPMDYGEVIQPDARRLMAQIARARSDAEMINRLIRLAHREIDHFAGNGIFYIIGGGAISKRVEEISAAERRLAFVDRILEGLQTLSGIAQTNLSMTDSDGAGPTQVTNKKGAIEEIDSELNELTAEGGISADLSEQRDDMMQLNQLLNFRRANKSTIASLLTRLEKKRTAWLKQQEALESEIAQKKADLETISGKMDALGSRGGGKSRVPVFVKLIEGCRKRSSTDAAAQRANTIFVQLMLKYIEQRQNRISYYESRRQTIDEEIEQLRQQLQDNHQMADFTENRNGGVNPAVSARFGEGVVLCTDRFFLELGQAPVGAVVTTPESGNGPVTYERQRDTIVEVS